jgi:hypothetical protein
MPMARRRCTKTGPYDVSDLTISLPVAKIGGFRTVLGRHLTQGPLKSLSFPAAFQADDEGSIPFTRSSNHCYLFTMSYLKAWRQKKQPEVGSIQQWYNIIGHR